MDAPARLPASEADLADWSVYADWLLTRADPRGELLALELAQSELPAKEALAAFHAAARRFCPTRGDMRHGWCLGQVRTLELVGEEIRLARAHFHSPPAEGMLAHARDLVRSPLGARLEQLRTPYASGRERHFRRLLSALPPTCRRVSVLVGNWTPDEVRMLLTVLPPTVRELVVEVHWRAGRQVTSTMLGCVDDRFDLVDLSASRVAPELHDEVLAALQRTSRVVVRVAELAVARIDRQRLSLADPAEAGLLDATRVTRLARWPLQQLQDRYGIVPVRAQLGDRLPEQHLLGTLVRRGTRFTAKAQPRERVLRNGAPLPDGAIVELNDRDALRIEHEAGGQDYVFIAHDLDAAYQ